MFFISCNLIKLMVVTDYHGSQDSDMQDFKFMMLSLHGSPFSWKYGDRGGRRGPYFIGILGENRAIDT